MRKMKKVAKMGKQILSMAVAVAMLAGMSQITSLAATEDMLMEISDENGEIEILEEIPVDDSELSIEITPYTMLADCIITARGASDGMHIDISTGVVGSASVVGVKDVKVYKKTWYGGWDLVATADGKEVKNRSDMIVSYIYRNAVKDATYKITCIHYGNVNGYIEGENDSGDILFTY